MFDDYCLCHVEAPVACIIVACMYGFDVTAPIYIVLTYACLVSLASRGYVHLGKSTTLDKLGPHSLGLIGLLGIPGMLASHVPWLAFLSAMSPLQS